MGAAVAGMAVAGVPATGVAVAAVVPAVIGAGTAPPTLTCAVFWR
jgi:hypothetical protein